MDIILLWIGGSIIVAFIAMARGRTGLGFFLLSLLISPLIAFIAVLVAKNGDQIDQEEARTHGTAGAYRKCPSCAEAVRREAIKCRFCGVELTPEPTDAEYMAAKAKQFARWLKGKDDTGVPY